MSIAINQWGTVEMIVWNSSNLILAIVGMLGLFSTAIVATYAFRRNDTGTGNFK